MAKKKSAKTVRAKRKDAPGVRLETIVTGIQQMMDPNTTVTHNEWLEDRVGNVRQYDVVIRGKFGGRLLLGVMECKDHNRKKGPDAVEAFAKKTENLGANFRLIVSKKGFTAQALKLAKHESIGCLSLLPEDPRQVGFSIGDMWYGEIRLWNDMRLVVRFASPRAPAGTFDVNTVKWAGKPVINWFMRELFTTYQEHATEGDFTLELTFDEQRNIEIEGIEYPVTGIACIAVRVCRKKRKWVRWSGDAFYDWHCNQLTIPGKGRLVGGPVETDLAAWPDWDGEIPELEKQDGFCIQVFMTKRQQWDDNRNNDVPELHIL